MAFNPFDVQKQMMQEFEKNLAQYLDKTMRDPEFMKLVARAMEANLDMRGLLKQNLAPALKALDVPTGDSLAEFFRTVHDLESRLLDLEEVVEDLGDRLKKAERSAPAKAPAASAPAAAPKKAAPKKAGPGSPKQKQPGKTPPAAAPRRKAK
jgi:uncharacterized protein YukE